MSIQRGAAKRGKGGRGSRGRDRSDSPSTPPSSATPPGVRLQRVMAEAGVASRRDCEAMIEEGRVEVNGRTVRGLPVFVDPARDRITVDGRPLPRQRDARRGPASTGARRLYIMLNKPGRTLTTTEDEGGRRTVLDLVQHPSGARLYPVGRLGFEATGLVLLTNDGDLANRLSHARYGVPKTYRAEVRGDLDESALHRLEREAFRSERRARKVEAAETAAAPAPSTGPKPPTGRVRLSVVKREAGKTVLEVTLAEGKNRQVERVLGEAGWPVKKLACTAIGPVELSAVAPGQWRELDREEIAALRKAAGIGGNRGAATPKKRQVPRPRPPASTKARPASERRR